MDLIADIGATNTRCALVNDKGQELAPELFANTDFSSLPGVLGAYLQHRRTSDRPTRAALAIAAPIIGETMRMVNIDWEFTRRELQEALGVSRLLVVNDFAAIARGLPHFSPAELEQVGGGSPVSNAPLATLGPGSGLGVAALVPGGDGPAVVSGEGGHAMLPAVTAEEAAVIERIRENTGTCVLESALSGPGLVNLYVALAQLAGRGTPTVTPVDVTSLAKQGEPLARKAQAVFFAFLATAAADLALTFGARGGLYIAGGIVPKILGALARSQFRERFEARGNHREYVSAIPTYVIKAPIPAFRGLRRLLGYH